MTDNLNDYYEQPTKQGLSTGAKVGIGCAATFIIVTVLICGGAWWWWSATWGPYQDFGDEFEQQGYTRVEGTGLDIQYTLTGPHVIVGWGINLEGDVEGDLAIAAWGANIEGTVNGDLDFYGMGLNIGPNAHITGDVRIRSAKGVSIEGEIDGELTGTWDGLTDRRRQSQPPAAPEPDQPDPDTEP